MTMTNDELRALADALSSGTHYVESPELHEAMTIAAAYLRACGDAQPIGYATANGLRMLKQDDTTVLLYKHDYLIRPDHVALYTRPAPSAPQAEPKREPLSDERIDEIGDPFGYFQYGDAQGDKRRAFARAIERAAYERAAKECDPHEDDDRIDRQIKREIAERIRALGRK